MTEQRRQSLREIMRLAWGKHRYERGEISFAHALRHAWAWFKGSAARAAAKARFAAAPQKRTVVFGSSVASPIRRSLTGKAYVYSDARALGRVTTALGI